MADVQGLLARLDQATREKFDRMADHLTKLEIGRTKTLGIEDEHVRYVGTVLSGQIEGVRAAMAILIGLDPAQDAQHEGAIDTHMRERWEESDWIGWPTPGEE